MARMIDVIYLRERDSAIVQSRIACSYVNDSLRPFFIKCMSSGV